MYHKKHISVFTPSSYRYPHLMNLMICFHHHYMYTCPPHHLRYTHTGFLHHIIMVFMKVVNNIFFSRGWHGQGHIRWKWWQSGSCWQANAILHMPSIMKRWWMIFQWKMHLYVGDVIGPFDVVFQTIHVRNDSCEAFLFLLLPSWSSSFWNGIAFGVWIYIFYNKLC